MAEFYTSIGVMTAFASCIVPGIVRRGIDFNKVKKRLETDMDGMVRTAAKLKKKYIHTSSGEGGGTSYNVTFEFPFRVEGEEKIAESFRTVSKEIFQQLPLEGDNVCVMYFEEEVTFNSLEREIQLYEKRPYQKNIRNGGISSLIYIILMIAIQFHPDSEGVPHKFVATIGCVIFFVVTCTAGVYFRWKDPKIEKDYFGKTIISSNEERHNVDDLLVV